MQTERKHTPNPLREKFQKYRTKSRKLETQLVKSTPLTGIDSPSYQYVQKSEDTSEIRHLLLVSIHFSLLKAWMIFQYKNYVDFYVFCSPFTLLLLSTQQLFQYLLIQVKGISNSCKSALKCKQL